MRSDDRINVLQFFNVILEFFGGNRTVQAFHDFQRPVKFVAPNRLVRRLLGPPHRLAKLGNQSQAAASRKPDCRPRPCHSCSIGRVLITLARRPLPVFLHRGQTGGIRLEFQCAHPIKRVAQIVKRLLLQLQIRRQRGQLKVLQRLVKIRRAIGRRARIEDQPQVVRVGLRQPL